MRKTADQLIGITNSVISYHELHGLHGFSFFVEGSEGFDAIEMVSDSGCLAATVHGEQWIAHVYTSEGQGGSEDVAQGAAACHVAVIDETLEGYACFLADAGKDGC